MRRILIHTQQASMRHIISSTVVALLGPIALIALTGSPAMASTTAPTTAAANRSSTTAVERYVTIAEVSGALDRIEADFLSSTLRAADRDDRVELIVIQLNSSRSSLTASELAELTTVVRDTKTPLAVWVGPGKARAAGGAVALLDAADVVSVGEGASIGPVGDDAWTESGTGKLFEALRDAKLDRAKARAAGLVDVDGPVLGELIVGLDGKSVAGSTLETAEVVRTREGPRQQPTVVPRFTKPSLGSRWLHNLASPALTYLFLLIGLVLIAFEFFSLGVGIAAGLGAICVVIAGYGLGANSIRPWALALLVLGVLGYCIDSQAGAPRAWTGIGTVASVVGTFGLFRSTPLPWLAAATGLIGTWLACVGGFSSMSRSRFATPTVGREAMIGKIGEVISDLTPDGVVRIDGALWRARTGRPTPAAVGSQVEVVALLGLVLEVEPLEETVARKNN